MGRGSGTVEGLIAWCTWWTLSAPETFETARNELHGLLKRETLGGIPLLVLGNKCDLEASVRVQEVVEAMELKRATGREVCCYNVSCKDKTNLSVCFEVVDGARKVRNVVVCR